MKKRIIIIASLFLLSCGNENDTKDIPKGCVKYQNKIVKIGETQDEFIRVLGNGDSLFRSYQVTEGGWEDNKIYYTRGGHTKSVNWEERNGKSYIDKTIIQ